MAVDIIPVIDLLGGRAVHARRGHRSNYQPVTAIGRGDGDPFALLEAYLRLAPFVRVYLADLDALMGGKPQWSLIERLFDRFEGPRFWLDAGLEGAKVKVHPKQVRVLGSESLTEHWALELAFAEVLSLDFRGPHFLGPPEILAARRRWPSEVVVMDLERVGSGEGPAFERLAAVRGGAPHVALYAGGGVRGNADLKGLADLGVSGALVATALLEGALDPTQEREGQRQVQ